MEKSRGRVRLPLILLACLLALPLWCLAGPQRAAAAPAGCGVSGEAYGVAAFVDLVIDVTIAKTPRATLPGASSLASLSQAGIGLGLMESASGDASTTTLARAESTADVADVDVNLLALLALGGISADAVAATAASQGNGYTATSGGGATFVGLTIGAQSYNAVAPNTVIPVAGLGSIILNEQIATGNGTTTSGLTVNAIHIDLAVTDVVIGSATSSISCAAGAITPAITALDPASIPAGSSDTTITVTGTRFAPGAEVRANGAPVATTIVNDGELTATIPAATLATPGILTLTVANPGGGVSMPADLPVTADPGTAPGLSDWAPQGGVLADSPAAASFNGRLYAFAVGTDPQQPAVHPLYVKSTADGATWSDWTSLGGNLTDAPAAATFNGRLYVFAKGIDPQDHTIFPLYVKSTADGTTWTGWQFEGGNLTAPPAAAAFAGRLYVFAKGIEPVHRATFPLYVKSSADGATWNGWADLGGNLTAAPAAAALNDRLYVFAKGIDPQHPTVHPMYVTSSPDGAAYGAWQDLGGDFSSAPAAAAFVPAGGSPTLAVLARSAGGDLAWARTTDGTTYSPWASLGGQVVGAPAAASHNGRLYILARWSDNTLYIRHTTP